MLLSIGEVQLPGLPVSCPHGLPLRSQGVPTEGSFTSYLWVHGTLFVALSLHRGRGCSERPAKEKKKLSSSQPLLSPT